MSWSWELNNCYSEEFITDFFSLTEDCDKLQQTISKLENLTLSDIKSEIKRLKKLRKARKKKAKKIRNHKCRTYQLKSLIYKHN